jgi:hypothetical protein
MIELPPLINTEEVGRAVWDSKKAKKAASGVIVPKIFREKDGTRELSVDRVSHGGLLELAGLHDGERSDQSFHGWASLSVERASAMNRKVEADPIRPQNPYHAFIILPDAENEEFVEAQTQHALNLAMASRWLPRPSGSG